MSKAVEERALAWHSRTVTRSEPVPRTPRYTSKTSLLDAVSWAVLLHHRNDPFQSKSDRTWAVLSTHRYERFVRGDRHTRTSLVNVLQELECHFLSLCNHIHTINSFSMTHHDLYL